MKGGAVREERSPLKDAMDYINDDDDDNQYISGGVQFDG